MHNNKVYRDTKKGRQQVEQKYIGTFLRDPFLESVRILRRNIEIQVEVRLSGRHAYLKDLENSKKHIFEKNEMISPDQYHQMLKVESLRNCFEYHEKGQPFLQMPVPQRHFAFHTRFRNRLNELISI